MSNPIIEVPEDIQNTVKRVLSGRDYHLATTVELAEFIHELYKPEIVVEDFVIYKVQVLGEDEGEYRMGFRVSRKVPFPWVTLRSNSPAKENAFGLTMDNQIHSAEQIKVIERWTPEEPEIEFGLPVDEELVRGREVLIRGKLISGQIDSEGDVFVELDSEHYDNEHYARAVDVAYVEEPK